MTDIATSRVTNITDPGYAASMHPAPQSRRWFLQRLGGVAGLTALATALPQSLQRWGIDPAAAFAQTADLTLDTFRGMAAFLWPGDDAYSVAQGESADRPGAIAASAAEQIVAALDFFVPAPDDAGSNDETLLLSQAAAAGYNAAALLTNPLAAGGAFPSPFARLSYAEKAEAQRFLEEDARDGDVTGGELSVVQLLYGLLPGFIQFFGFTEGTFFDPATKTLTGRPVGWDHTGYQGDRTIPVEGWDEFTGYWRGRRAADPSTDAVRNGGTA